VSNPGRGLLHSGGFAGVEAVAACSVRSWHGVLVLVAGGRVGEAGDRIRRSQAWSNRSAFGTLLAKGGIVVALRPGAVVAAGLVSLGLVTACGVIPHAVSRPGHPPVALTTGEEVAGCVTVPKQGDHVTEAGDASKRRPPRGPLTVLGGGAPGPLHLQKIVHRPFKRYAGAALRPGPAPVARPRPL
jgi:hypothetical protein